MVEKLLEVCKVSPSLGLSTDICLPLTFLDLIWLRRKPVEVLLFYDFPFHPEVFFSSVLPKLKHTLAQTLQHFLPVAGNLTWPDSSSNPFISYREGDGVIVTVTQSDDDFFHLSSNNIREANIYQSLKANISVSDSQAQVFALKVTLFPNKGFCIGITEHHAVFDQTSFTMFIETWASLTKLCEGNNQDMGIQPMFERKSIRECFKGLENVNIDALMKQNEANPRSLSTQDLESPPYDLIGAFQLSGLDVKRLKDTIRAKFQIHNHKELNSGLHVSTFTVTYAYLIVCLARAKEQTENVCFSIVIDLRSRLEPPIPANYFGTCIGFLGGHVKREKLMSDDAIIVAIGAVNRAMQSLNDGVLIGAEKWILPITTDEDANPTSLTLSGSTKLKMYYVDFGFGKPRKYFNASIESGSISLTEGKCGDGGVEIELCLSKHEMEKFAFTFAQGLTDNKLIKSAI